MDRTTARTTWRRAFLTALSAALFVCAACRPAADAAGEVAGATREATEHPMVGRRGPDFAVQDPGGPWLPLASLQGKPLALLFFRTGAPFAADLVRETARYREDGGFVPVVFLGIVTDPMEEITRFRDAQRTPLPLLRDPGSIARAYGVGTLPAVVLLDADHVIRFHLDGYLGSRLRPNLQATTAALRDLPVARTKPIGDLPISYSEHPRAPLFAASDLEGRWIDLARLRDRVVVLTFFDQECPHCQTDLPALAAAIRELRPQGVTGIGVAGRDRDGRMRDFLKEHGVDFPVIIDGERAIFSRYQSSRTPDTFIIDGDGFVRFHEQGDRPDRREVTLLQLRIALGRETPAAIAASLPKGRYSGDGVCRSCHSREYRDWLFTPHSLAWESLQTGDKWRDPECVACHVTGGGRPGGYGEPGSTPHLVNVQCEVCHGAGGGHAEGRSLDLETVAATCSSCHTGKFVLNFDRDEALALVSHRDRPDLDRLFSYSELQRQRLDQVNSRRLERFRSGVAHVGAEACRDCHRREFDQWSRSPHAAAFATLLQAGRGSDRDCTPCHTTGSGLPGGFEDPAAAVPMTGVQCEVCHGPGADHLAAPAALKKETIYGITDQCSFCIIQGVCVTCHDRANDPDFDIERLLPLVRHAPAGKGDTP